MKIDTIYPTDPLLKKHIEFFYFVKTGDTLFDSKYYVFPHTLKSLNIHKNAACFIHPGSIHVFESKETNNIAILQGKYEQPVLVRLSGRLDKVTVIFKPLGLNHFISKDFGEVAGAHSQVFLSWERSTDYRSMLDAFYSTGSLAGRAEILERFLLSQYRPLPEYDMMQSIISSLENWEAPVSLKAIAASQYMSEKTLNRLFKKHLAFNPSSYRKIAKFRHSLSNRLVNDSFHNLANVSYESNYYDPSYFNRIYNELTGTNPKAFFNSIARLPNDQIVFKFIKDLAQKQ